VASIAAGMLTTLAWEVIGLRRGTTETPEYLLGLQTVYPALFLSIATLVVVSLATGAGDSPAPVARST
jgi:hypothetical protein